ncbi:glycosyltransferase family 4 protein [Pseudoalteromonas sp. JBTF-M23]|uniref:Glycosyltransferase family 4 protein n=1 Tax=Pseudoalteromonas caenipelagi TaxID=2726988 RepID=A0A849VJ88_9GAMM|nr:glycosyltransferase family 4 protein [Pseudoalteromonas caenipelagi]
MSRICFISNLFPSEKDPSFGSFVGKNYAQFEETGHEIVSKVVIDHRAKGLRKLLCYIRFIYQGIFALAKRNYDVVYIHYLTYSTICLLPFLVFSKPKYVINVHGDDLVGASLIHKIMGLSSPWVIKHSAAIVVPSEYFKTRLLDMYPWYSKQNVIVSESAGVDFDLFKPQSEVIKDKFNLGYVSRIDEGKGWPELLKAIALIKSKTPERLSSFELNMYGTGAQVEELRQMIDSLKLNSLVRYHGALAQSQLVEQYNAMSAFIFPTHRESFGLVAVEALACGTPVLASNISPVNEVVKHGINGLLFDVKNEHSIAKSIIELIDMKPERYQEMKRSTRSSVLCYESNNVISTLNENLTKRSIFKTCR